MPTIFAQKFTTTTFTGGCQIHVQQDNPWTPKGTIPTSVIICLYQWDTNYTTTVGGTSLVTEKAIVPSEEVEDGEMWVYAYWKPLIAGAYMWELTVQTEASDPTGTFQVLRDTGSTYYDAYEGDDTGVANVAWDFHSYIMGLESTGETYESIMSLGDAFTGSYATDTGHANPQINRGTTASPSYVNSIYAQDPVTLSTGKAGRIASGSLVKLN